MRCSRIVAGVLAIATATVIQQAGNTPTAEAANGRCYGASCNGQDPTVYCNKSAVTVAAQAVRYGMLELRYSRNCASNWARYTPYTRSVTSFAGMDKSLYPRLRVWNPGARSYGLAYFPKSNIYGSSWTYMTDGTITACAGVEVVVLSENGSTDPLGWQWGPCV